MDSARAGIHVLDWPGTIGKEPADVPRHPHEVTRPVHNRSSYEWISDADAKISMPMV